MAFKGHLFLSLDLFLLRFGMGVVAVFRFLMGETRVLSYFFEELG